MNRKPRAILKKLLSARRLKRVKMQGGTRGEERGVLSGTPQRRASGGVPAEGGSPQMGLFQQPAESPPTTADVRAFWERNPVAAASIAASPGTPEFFAAFDRLREDVEPAAVQERVYDFVAARGKRVLDVGCGNGYVLSRYARAGARAFGVDLTRTAVDLARARFRLHGLAGTFLQADAERLPFGDGVFDLAVSVGVLHHVPDIGRAIEEIRRVLRPGGQIILMLYHRNSLHYRVLYPLYGLVRPAFRGHPPAEIARRIDGADNPIGRTYSRREMRGLLSAFRDVRLEAASVPARPFRLLPGGERLRDALARGVGWFLYATGTRPAVGNYPGDSQS